MAKLKEILAATGSPFQQMALSWLWHQKITVVVAFIPEVFEFLPTTVAVGCRGEQT